MVSGRYVGCVVLAASALALGVEWAALDATTIARLPPAPSKTSRAHPGDPDTVYAIATGMVVGGGGAQEFRSRDAGVSWTELHTPGFTGPFAALPTTPTSLIGQTYQGFAVSRDHGDTWTTTAAGPPEGAALVGDARRPHVVFAGTSYRGVYRSFDRGLTWQPTGRVTDRPGG